MHFLIPPITLAIFYYCITTKVMRKAKLNSKNNGSYGIKYMKV